MLSRCQLQHARLLGGDIDEVSELRSGLSHTHKKGIDILDEGLSENECAATVDRCRQMKKTRGIKRGYT